MTEVIEQVRHRVFNERIGSYSVALNHLLNELHGICYQIDSNGNKSKDYDANQVVQFLQAQGISHQVCIGIRKLFDRRNTNQVSHSGSKNFLAWSVSQSEYLQYHEIVSECLGVLIKSGIVAAGDPVLEKNIAVGTCVQVMTGAPVPPDAEAVVPVENIKIEGENILFASRPEAGANIRNAGEDFRKGVKVLEIGQAIHSQHIMPLAALGIGMIEVFKKPRAAFISTGRELVDDLSESLKPGQIYNSNRPYALAALDSMGIDCVSAQTTTDDPEKFELILKDIMAQDVEAVISSGAVSAGSFDFVRAALEKIGAEIIFHNVKIKPGKPNLFARPVCRSIRSVADSTAPYPSKRARRLGSLT